MFYLKRLSYILLIIQTLIACKSNNNNSKITPKKVEIYWTGSLMSTEYLDTNGNVIEKINPTFMAYKLEDCPSTDSTIRWEYKYENGKLIETKEIESCRGQIQNVVLKHIKYDKENRITKEFWTDISNDTLSVTNYRYKDSIRYDKYFNIKQDYIKYDSVIINQNNNIKIDRKILGNLITIDSYEYDSLERKQFWRQVYIKNDTDTVRNRLGKYYYNHLGHPKKINVIEVDVNGNEIEKNWISYQYTYYE